MNALIESLNSWGERFADTAAPIFWQSSLLIALVFVVDLLLRRKLRPAVRYALWLVVLVKLVLPPTLALPTGPAWWLRAHKPELPKVQTRVMTVTTSDPAPNFIPPSAIPLTPLPPPTPKLSPLAWTMLGSVFISAFLAAWSASRWWKISRCIRKTIIPSAAISELLTDARHRAGVRKNVAIRLTSESMSPAVCGLLRPVILLPQPLIEKLSPEQLRAVLLHELIHVRRRDVWINCAQTLLQIIYWWHPLVWFANARIRRVREDAVDDAVMFALKDEAEIYAPTLLEVAKLAFHRPLPALGFVGILESRDALRHRIERLLNFKTPGRAGLSAVWIFALTAFTAIAVPMGEPPAKDVSASGLNERLYAAIGNNTQTPQTTPTQAVPVNTPGSNPVTQPSPQRIEDASSATDNSVQTNETHGVTDLVEQAKLLYEHGKLDEAWVTFQKVLNTAPDNQAALHYSALIKQAQTPKPMDGTQGTPPQQTSLAVRTFKLDEATIRLNFGPIKSSSDIQPVLANLFQKAGIDMTPPKSFFFNNRAGTLTVRATTNDLDMLEQIVMTLNITPPEVNIRARFVEVDAGNFGMEALLQEFLTKNNAGPNSNAWTGVLTRPTYAQVMQAIEKDKGAKVLNQGEITTLSGRQANFQIIDVRTLVNGLNATVTNNQTSYRYDLTNASFGSTLDVVPTVSEDTNAVTMIVTPRISEFLGYENPRDLAKYDEKLKHAQLPLPRSRIRETTTTATVQDGQTLVIGNLSDQWALNRPDGTQLRQPNTDKKKKQLFIFITATIIDRAGNPLHRADNYGIHPVHSRDYYDFPVVP